MMSKTYRAPAKTEITPRERYEAEQHARRRDERTRRLREAKGVLDWFALCQAPSTLEQAARHLANV